MQLLLAKFTGNGINRGDIIEVRATDHPFGGNEQNAFVVAQVTDASMTSFLYLNNTQWHVDIDYEIISSDLLNDIHQMRVYALNVNSAGLGSLTRQKIEQYLNGWNIEIDSVSENQVILTVDISAVLQSNEFWNYDNTSVIITELNYDQVTGNHTLQIDYSALQRNPTGVENKAIERGGEIVSHSGRVLVANFTRADVRDKFFNEIKDKIRFDDRVVQFRYYVPNAAVNFIESNGGFVNTDIATLQGYIRDKLAD